MRVLVIGDIVGSPGVDVVEALVPGLREELGCDLVIANGENAAKAGVGITRRIARRLLDVGIDGITLGNHALRQQDVTDLLRGDEPIIRPQNLPGGAPGSGLMCVQAADGTRLAVINVLGNLFIEAAASPFEIIDGLIERAADLADCILVDMHAETTSEKIALASYVAGRVSAVVGTHTHVQTSDARILSGGTAYITDLGMSGPHDSVIGVRSDIIVRRFRTGFGARFEVAEGGVQLEGVVIDIDPATGQATAIEALRRAAPD